MTSDLSAPNPIDLHVGARLRLRRKSLKMSQQVVGDALGLTFQQVQKYERGANRISSSKLYEVGQVLQVPVTYFFEGYGEGNAGDVPASEAETAVQDFLMTEEGVELAASFPRITKARWRRKVLDLVKTLGEN